MAQYWTAPRLANLPALGTTAFREGAGKLMPMGWGWCSSGWRARGGNRGGGRSGWGENREVGNDGKIRGNRQKMARYEERQ